MVASLSLNCALFHRLHAGGCNLQENTAISYTAASPSISPLTPRGILFSQIVSTALLTMLILAITDPDNMNPHKGMIPFFVGLLVMVIGMSLGHNCGYAMNPGRDWGPRIFSCMIGWGAEPFS